MFYTDVYICIPTIISFQGLFACFEGPLTSPSTRLFSGNGASKGGQESASTPQMMSYDAEADSADLAREEATTPTLIMLPRRVLDDGAASDSTKEGTTDAVTQHLMERSMGNATDSALGHSVDGVATEKGKLGIEIQYMLTTADGYNPSFSRQISAFDPVRA